MPGVPLNLAVNETLGQPIPSDTIHAVSVSLPTWRSNVGYEEGEKWVVDKMQIGYPRFFINKCIDRLATMIVNQYGDSDTELAMLLPTPKSANRCIKFLTTQNPSTKQSSIRTFDFVPQIDGVVARKPGVSAVIYPKPLWPTAKAFWQHTGEGISSRRAEYCRHAFENMMKGQSNSHSNHTPNSGYAKGPKRYQRHSTDSTPKTNGAVNGESDASVATNGVDSANQFVEERFGRNLDATLAAQAKVAIRRRIAGNLTNDSDLPGSLESADDLARTRSRDVPGFSADDVYLYSCGMNAIFSAHLALRSSIQEYKSISYGFPYVDTLKVLQKFGPGAVFYGHGSSAELDDLQQRLESGEKFLSLFCEFPGNPLLRTPDLKRIRSLADKYDFAVVVDETIGNFLNVHVLPYADVVVSSLTKIFSGDSNVMGGSMILNPRSKYYDRLKNYLNENYEDNHFEEDSIYLERNSRDFVSRSARVNHNAEVIADILRSHPSTKQVNYPKYSDTKHLFDTHRLPNGGYGGLLSATFHRLKDAQTFYDHLDTQKGPSLGTNFTLSSPFVLLAHYGELEWAEQFGCEVSLVRFSVGLEDTETLRAAFERALDAISTNASIPQ